MSEIWIISDTHFGHENIIKFANRPFKDAQHMDEMLVHNWNSTVKPGDKVYHLGDVYFQKGLDKWGAFFSRLHGSKRLILGNHDDGKDKLLQNTFQKIMVWRIFKDFGLVLSHVPIHPQSLSRAEANGTPRQLHNIHGHIHDQNAFGPMYTNVCVEKTNYTPVNIEELRKK